MAHETETVTFHWLKCDACGAPSNADTKGKTTVTREDAREEAAMMGWREIPAHGTRPADVCDACKEKPAAPCDQCGQRRGFTEDSGYVWCACTADGIARPSAFAISGVLGFANSVALAIGASPGDITFRGDNSFRTASTDGKIQTDVIHSKAGLPETPSVWDVYLYGEGGAERRTVFTYVHDAVPTPQALRAMMATDPVAALILDRAPAWKTADRRPRVAPEVGWPLIIRLAAIIGASPNSAAPEGPNAATILTSLDEEVTATVTALLSPLRMPCTVPPMWVVTLRAPRQGALVDLVIPAAGVMTRTDLEATIRAADGATPILDRSAS